MAKRLLTSACVLALSSVLVTCSGGSCAITALSVSPPSAAVSVGASQQFNASPTGPSGSCTIGAGALAKITWSVSDSVHVSISSTGGPATATCLGATSGPATVTAVLGAANPSQPTGTATLTCN